MSQMDSGLAANAPDVGQKINHDKRWSKVFEIQTVAFVQEIRKPEQV